MWLHPVMPSTAAWLAAAMAGPTHMPDVPTAPYWRAAGRERRVKLCFHGKHTVGSATQGQPTCPRTDRVAGAPDVGGCCQAGAVNHIGFVSAALHLNVAGGLLASTAAWCLEPLAGPVKELTLGQRGGNTAGLAGLVVVACSGPHQAGAGNTIGARARWRCTVASVRECGAHFKVQNCPPCSAHPPLRS